MRLILDFWNRVWQSVSYETTTGNGRVRWFSGRSESCAGWAYRRHGQWFAVWKEGEQWIFQAGIRRWPLDNQASCKLTEFENARRFTLSIDGNVEFTIEYKPPCRYFDVTFDDLDDEMQDFFLWLSRVRFPQILRETGMCYKSSGD